MLKNKAYGFSLPSEIISQIDNDRGEVSRSRFVLRLLQKAYLYQSEGMEKKGPRLTGKGFGGQDQSEEAVDWTYAKESLDPS